MFGASLLVLLATWCTVSSSQPVLTQEPSISTSLGKTVRFSCSMSSGEVTSYAQSWYQQAPGSPPRFLYYFYSSAVAGSGDLSRFSASKASSQNIWYLTISNVQPEDEANYYCAVWHGSSSMWVFGGGTQLTVTDQNPVHPSVFLFPPSQEEIKTKSKATLVCLMDEFHPGVVQVEWKADGTTISSGVETTKPVKQGNKYVASSYLTLSESDWKSHNKYACKVTHESETIEKEVNRSECS
ncbi:immunoglobulin lambda-1 light chain-like isoform X4 [Sceloporus undulatus]|uniref:immunoglobulin lambda-1 light chain-like isoform X4 n=1 Tax=Sceloporus undulatus TaxID=8520 RepID=UPI001C4CE390|nr:immunoglobulin lambda-1 light chain-like isoform X4 [Sceloporus undulatus]